MKTMVKTLFIALLFITSAPILQAMGQAEARLAKIKQLRQAQKERLALESLDLTQEHYRLDVLQKVLAALQDVKDAETHSMDKKKSE